MGVGGICVCVCVCVCTFTCSVLRPRQCRAPRYIAIRGELEYTPLLTVTSFLLLLCPCRLD